MKKLILMLSLLMFIMFSSVSVFAVCCRCPAPETHGPCYKVWENVSGEDYFFVVNDDKYFVMFSESGVGPCPQGECNIYLNEELIGTCSYISRGEEHVKIECGKSSLIFLIHEDQLIYLPENVFILERYND